MRQDLQPVAVIVQARTGSKRFPKKMLAELAGVPLIEWVLRRVAASHRANALVLAIPESDENEKLSDFAKRWGFAVFRGSEEDVLSRFLGAARSVRASSIVRVCADNPFIDPGEIDRLISFFESGDFDYAFNHLDRLGGGYADGFGAEILSFDCLCMLNQQASRADHREHVTKFIWDSSALFRIGVCRAPFELNFPKLRFDIDTPEDLNRLQDLANRAGMQATAADIVRISGFSIQEKVNVSDTERRRTVLGY